MTLIKNGMDIIRNTKEGPKVIDKESGSAGANLLLLLGGRSRRRRKRRRRTTTSTRRRRRRRKMTRTRMWSDASVYGSHGLSVRKGVKDKVKDAPKEKSGPDGPPTRSRGPTCPQTSSTI